MLGHHGHTEWIGANKLWFATGSCALFIVLLTGSTGGGADKLGWSLVGVCDWNSCTWL